MVITQVNDNNNRVNKCQSKLGLEGVNDCSRVFGSCDQKHSSTRSQISALVGQMESNQLQMLKGRNGSDRAKDKRDMMVEVFLRQGIDLSTLGEDNSLRCSRPRPQCVFLLLQLKGKSKKWLARRVEIECCYGKTLSYFSKSKQLLTWQGHETRTLTSACHLGFDSTNYNNKCK